MATSLYLVARTEHRAPLFTGRLQIRCDVESVADSNPSTQDSNIDFGTEITWGCRTGFKERINQRHEGTFTETCTTGPRWGRPAAVTRYLATPTTTPALSIVIDGASFPSYPADSHYAFADAADSMHCDRPCQRRCHEFRTSRLWSRRHLAVPRRV